MTKNDNASIYEKIAANVVNGKLRDGFLIAGKDAKYWDGAKDGITFYHLGLDEPTEEQVKTILELLHDASEKNFEKAYEGFAALSQELTALDGADALIDAVVDFHQELEPDNLYNYACATVVKGCDIECVKYALALLYVFDTGSNKVIRNVIRTIGLCDEFTLFAIDVMKTWENGNEEIFKLAQKVKGWGRIHAIEQLAPKKAEMKRWLLMKGVHNDISPSYSALTCFVKADVEKLLQGNLTREEFRAIRDIMAGLVDEGPVTGMSEFRNRNEIIYAFLKQAEKQKLNNKDKEIIKAVLEYCYEEECENKRIDILANDLIRKS